MSLSRFSSWFVLAFYCGVIFYLSSKPVLHVSHDKFAHLAEYALFGFLLAWALGSSFQIKPHFLILLATALSIFYGVTDEFHQSFVPGRDSSVYDVMADAVGSLTGVLFYVLLHRLQRAFAPSA